MRQSRSTKQSLINPENTRSNNRGSTSIADRRGLGKKRVDDNIQLLDHEGAQFGIRLILPPDAAATAAADDVRHGACPDRARPNSRKGNESARELTPEYFVSVIMREDWGWACLPAGGRAFDSDSCFCDEPVPRFRSRSMRFPPLPGPSSKTPEDNLSLFCDNILS